MSSHAATTEKFAQKTRAGAVTVVASICAVSLLLFAVGCGSSSSSPFPITGSYSNASLSGQYAFSFSGRQVVASNGTTEGAYREAGVFTADGNGNITAGTEDFNSAGVFGTFSSTAITGKYSIGKDGNGVVQLNVGGGTETWAITLVSSSKFYITEADAFSNFAANATGQGEKQDTSALGSVPNGTFVFRAHQNLPTGSPIGLVGQIVSNAGSVTGTADVVQTGFGFSGAITGTFTQLDSAGRGTLVLTINGTPNSFNYYIVNANTLLLLETDSTVLGLGRVEAQSGAPFSASSISGNFAFGTTGDTANNLFGVNTAGAFTVTTGAISAGTYDSVQDGNPILNQAYTGTISGPDANTGRVQTTITPTGPGNQATEIWYLVSPTRAFVVRFYASVSGLIEDGTIDAQTGGPFTNGSLKGQYAFLMGGSTNLGSNLLSRVGTFIPDGNGNLNINETTNLYTGAFAGSIVTSPIYITGGTYTAGSNGRFTASAPNLSSNLVLYMVSPSKAYILQGDSTVQEFGPVELQQ